MFKSFIETFLLLVFAYTCYGQIVTKGYNHVALSVRDLETSTKFYKEVLGLQSIAVPRYLQKVRSWFKIADGQELHLLTGRQDTVTNNDPNHAHFCLSIESADPVEQHLITIGLPYLRQQRFDGAWQIYITDPDGYVIELNEPPVKWKYLFNDKDLGGWNTYLGPQWPSDGSSRDGITALGLNVDPKNSFDTVIEEGRPALRISGEQWGSISTVDNYSNYHLQLEFKWGDMKFFPREKVKRDSGILYHAVGDYGADWGFWMESCEFQIQEGDCGDFWGLGNIFVEARTDRYDDKEQIFNYQKPLKTFERNAPYGRHIIKRKDAEFEHGTWNMIDIYCFEDKAIHVMNGDVVLVLENIKHKNKDGNLVPLTSGKIEIQSEGAEIFYRNIKISPIKGIPANLYRGL